MDRGVEVVNVRDRSGISDTCNCCSYKDRVEGEDVYEISFHMGNVTQVVRLCERHMEEMASEMKAEMGVDL